MRYLRTFGIALLASACSEPRCPSGWMEDGDLCRRCKRGEQYEHGQCLAIVDSGDAIAMASEDGGSPPAGSGSPPGGSGDGAAGDDGILDASEAHASEPLDGSIGALSDSSINPETAIDAGPATTDSASPGDSVQEAGGEVVTCALNPCQRGGRCVDGPSGRSCSCPQGSTGKDCELDVCGPTTITSSSDLEEARSCAEVRGDLKIASRGLASIAVGDLPNLALVTGSIEISALFATNPLEPPPLETVTLDKLESIGGGLIIAGGGSPQQVYLPALQTIGKTAGGPRSLYLVAAEIRTLHAPLLRAINGDVTLQDLLELCSLRLGALTEVTGKATLRKLFNVPASTLLPITSNAKGAVTTDLVGCCFGADKASCDAFTFEAYDAYCDC